MYTRHNEVPVLEQRDYRLDAAYFNHVQYALNHLGDQIRLPIPKLKHLDLILQKDAWVIVDRVLNDVPVAAWTGFQTSHRDSLHEPINCVLRTYHANAGLITDRTLEAMELLLGERLADNIDSLGGKVLTFPAKD